MFNLKSYATKATAGLATAAMLTLAAPTATYAHHGINGQFDLSQTLKIEGTVTRVRFVNPHSYVYFDVTADDGSVEGWRCELRSGSLLRRKGWTTDLFAEGSTISIFGSPAREEPTTCYTETITFENGDKLFRYGGVADDGTMLNDEDSINAAQNLEEVEEAAAEAKNYDFTGDWGEPAASGPPFPYGGRGGPMIPTEAALAVANNWTQDDNPRFKCQPTNIILDYRFDQMVNRFTQTDDMLEIKYGFMDLVRQIHIGGSFPDEIEPSLAGYSVGEFDGDKLVVHTKGFAPGFLEAVGGRSTSSLPHSDQMEVKEVFYVDDAGELVREYEITDPVYLAETYVHLHKAVNFDGEYYPFECDDLTVE